MATMAISTKMKQGWNYNGNLIITKYLTDFNLSSIARKEFYETLKNETIDDLRMVNIGLSKSAHLIID